MSGGAGDGMMNHQRSIDDVAETLQNAKGRGKGCTLLIGAGCSVKAGIPSAAGLVQVIKDRYPRAYQRAKTKTYARCMSELLLSERRDLIAEYVDQAKINWAHLCIALLVQAGYVDRVLSTNFDLLVVRACALLNEFPAIYDFAASQLFKAPDIPRKAVIYLHGQYTGFILINTEEDFDRHTHLLEPVFEDAGRGRVWLVVGYSGENDPVFNHLARVPRFDNGLYWAGYQNAEPPRHVEEQLLNPGKDAFYVKGYDADSFFITLTQKLAIFPPRLLAQPFSHIKSAMEMLTPYGFPGQASAEDVTRTPRRWIDAAIEQFERGTLSEGAFAAALKLLLAGAYESVLEFRKEYDKNPSPELGDPLSWAYVMQGNALSERAKTKSGEEAERLFLEAAAKYQAALGIKPNMPEALNNWGNALADQARIKKGNEVDALFAEAAEKYKAALAIKEDMAEALFNWGNTLLDHGGTKTGDEADRLFSEAAAKYQAALAMRPDMHEAFFKWGNVLLEQRSQKEKCSTAAPS
jgi:tetratricopeptide (TPR) repeat protein